MAKTHQRSTTIGTTIHDEVVTVTGFAQTWRIRIDGAIASSARDGLRRFITEADAVADAEDFVPTHRRAR